MKAGLGAFLLNFVCAYVVIVVLSFLGLPYWLADLIGAFTATIFYLRVWRRFLRP